MKIFIIIGFLLINLQIRGQEIMRETRKSISENENSDIYPLHSFTPGNNIAGSALRLTFWIYKTTVSSQDFGSCSFMPSCSEYAVRSIEKKGLLTGYLMTFDRLSRCHSLSNSKYKTDPETGLLIDNVE